MALFPGIAPGLVLGDRYRLDLRIGRGGMGEVWRARDETLETDVAVKLLLAPSSPEEFEEAKARFDIEQRALISLRSRYVVRIHDRGLSEHGQPYFVMELLAGRSLQDHLEEHERLEVPEVLEILEDLGRAVHEPHLKGLAHRDIKPGNVFLTEFPGQRRLEVRLLDFGVAKSIGGESEDGSVTSDGMIVGTPLYVAPEQIDGTPTLGSDIYSIGVVAYRCLAGVPPFRGEQHAVLRQHLGAAPPSLPPDVGVPPPLETLIRTMLSKQPELRPTPAELVADVVSIRGMFFAPPSAPKSDPALAPTFSRRADLDSDLLPLDESDGQPITRNFEPSGILAPMEALRSRPTAVALLVGGIAIILLMWVAGLIAGWYRPTVLEATPLTSSRPETDRSFEADLSRSADAHEGRDDESTPKQPETLPAPEDILPRQAPAPAAARPLDAKSGAEARPRSDSEKRPVRLPRERSEPRATAGSGPTSRPRSAPTSASRPEARSVQPAKPPRRAPSAAAKSPTVRLGFRAGPGARILKLRIEGKNYSSPPIFISLPSDSDVRVEFLEPSGQWQERTIHVPPTGGVVTLE